MADDIQTVDPVLLWPAGAPGATGQGSEDCPRLSPLLPRSESPTAAVVVCPGGAYMERADHEGEPVAHWLCSLGVAGLVLDYRVAPYRHPAPLQDAQRAVRIVRTRADEWNIDPRRVGILGFSAGGHVAISAATLFDRGKADDDDPVARQSSRPDMLIACYPVVTFGQYGNEPSMINLLGEDPDPELRKHLSLETRVTAETPPAFLWHTADDQSVPVENSLMLAAELSRCGVPFALHVFPHGEHGLGLAEDRPDVGAWPSICAEWLGQIGASA